jgi:hypothetical protein
MRPEELCGLLAERDRLAVFAAVALGASTPERVAELTGRPARVVEKALARLVRGGLVGPDLTTSAEPFKHAVRSAAPARPVETFDADPRRDAVLRSFLSEGRLVRFPAAWSKRRIVLEHIAAVFEPGVKYPEREVDAILRSWHADHAALRRYLVDENLLARADNEYWRTGGYVDVTG